MKNKQATLTLFCGLPGSGKTTLAKKLEKEGNGIRICTDDWQEALGMNHSYKDFHELLQKQLYKHALELLEKGQDVILEDGLWMQTERDEKYADATTKGAIVEMHFFDLSFQELWRRTQKRNKNLPFGAVKLGKDDLEKFWNIFEKPTKQELDQFESYKIYTDTN